MKKCTKCGETKPSLEFSKNHTSKDGYDYVCRVCRSEYRKALRLADVEGARARERARYAANIEGERETDRQWNKNNPDKAREKHLRYRTNNLEKCREMDRENYRKNPNKNREKAIIRKARLNNAVIEDFSYLEIFERDEWVCQLCLDPIDPQLRRPNLQSKSLDHIIPVSKEGNHTRDNVQAAHLLCNMKKNDKMPSH